MSVRSRAQNIFSLYIKSYTFEIADQFIYLGTLFPNDNDKFRNLQQIT